VDTTTTVTPLLMCWGWPSLYEPTLGEGSGLGRENKISNGEKSILKKTDFFVLK